MGHQHHFLSRLDRVSLPQVELALSLYRDHDLLRYLLAKVELPERAERVAISLEHPERGPFLIVTREGRFVTCLAEGMHVSDLPIVTRGQLDGTAVRMADLRARIETARTLAGPKGETGKLLRRIYTAGPDLSREELTGISAFQPLLEVEFCRLYLGSVTDLVAARESLIKIERPRPALHPHLRAYWDTFWTVGHLAVLGLMNGRELLGFLPKEAGLSSANLAWGAVRQGILAVALRGLWGVAKIGKSQLPAYKEALVHASSHMTLIDGAMGLAGIGMRHTKLRAEVRKALGATRSFDEGPDGRYLQELHAAILSYLEVGFDQPEVAAETQRKLGADLGFTLTRHLPAGSPFRFDRAEDVPDDLAMTLATNHRAEFFNNVDAILHLAMFLPWVARAEPEQLYLPGDFLSAIRRPWAPSDTAGLIAPIRDHYRTREPTAKAPSRQGPCPCGSGRKYKRCCDR